MANKSSVPPSHDRGLSKTEVFKAATTAAVKAIANKTELNIVYTPIAHWMWQPMGFMSTRGMLDFAGGTVVHINAGVAGLVTAMVMGKRLGNPDDIKPYSVLLSLVGAALLWVGWFGFNAGSAVAAMTCPARSRLEPARSR